MDALRGKRVLVVGASAGIGRHAGTALVAGGAEVAFAARRREALQDAVTGAGGGHAVELDVRDEAGSTRAVAEAVERLGGLDVLLYATGVSPLRPLVELDAADWSSVLETNVVGAALVTRAALPHLEGHGLAVYLSSDSVRRPRKALVAYSTSKAALETLVQGLRVEHPDVRFATIVVGPTAGTEFADGFDHDLMSEMYAHWLVEGHMTREVMDAADLGAVLAETLASMVAHPGIDLREVLVQPPGAALTPDPSAALRLLSEPH